MIVLNKRITPPHKNKKHKKKAPLPSSVPVYATEFMLLLLHATHKHYSARGASILTSLFPTQHISNIDAPLDRYFRCVGFIAAVATCVYLWEFRPVWPASRLLLDLPCTSRLVSFKASVESKVFPPPELVRFERVWRVGRLPKELKKASLVQQYCWVAKRKNG